MRTHARTQDLALEAVPDLEDQMDAWGAAPAAPKLPAGPEERLPGGQQQGHEQQGQGQGQGSVQEQGQGQQEESVGPLGQAPGGGGCSSGAAAAGQQVGAVACMPLLAGRRAGFRRTCVRCWCWSTSLTNHKAQTASCHAGRRSSRRSSRRGGNGGGW